MIPPQKEIELPLLQVLVELGGSAPSKDDYIRVAARFPGMTESANPGAHANRTHSFLATGVRRVQEPTPEATEDLRVHLAGPDEVRRVLE